MKKRIHQRPDLAPVRANNDIPITHIEGWTVNKMAVQAIWTFVHNRLRI